MRQEPNLPREGIRPPFAFTSLGHLHLRPRPFQSGLIIIIVILIITFFLGKHGPRARFLLQSPRPDLDVRLLGTLILSLSKCRPDRNVKVAPRTGSVVQLQPVRRLVHVDPLVVAIYIFYSILPSSSMEPC